MTSPLTQTELKRVRQYLSPNIRMEIDMHMRTGLPLNEPLVQLLRKKLALHRHKEVPHGHTKRTA